MGDVLVDLLPVMIGATAVPLYPIVVLLLLQSKGGLSKSMAFVSGAVGIRLVQGVLFGFVLTAAMAANSEDGGDLIVSTLLMIVGVLLLVAAFKKWRKEEDPDAPSPQWMTTLSDLTTLKAVGAGAFYVMIAVKQWVFTLSAISIIDEAELGRTVNIGLYLFYTLIVQLLGVIPILMVAVAPQQSAKPLKAAQSWLVRHNRVIVIIVSLIFGVWFMVKGVTGLLG